MTTIVPWITWARFGHSTFLSSPIGLPDEPAAAPVVDGRLGRALRPDRDGPRGRAAAGVLACRAARVASLSSCLARHDGASQRVSR